jgi:DNA-binding response OmpR family regulator
VIVASDGEEALDCLYRRGEFQTRDAGNPMLVLLDLKMPKLNGLEVLSQIRADAQFKCMPVVVFSSSRQETDVTNSYELGANAYVVKPVNFRDFTTAIKAIKMFWLGINEPPPASRPGSTASVMQTATAA